MGFQEGLRDKEQQAEGKSTGITEATGLKKGGNFARGLGKTVQQMVKKG